MTFNVSAALVGYWPANGNSDDLVAGNNGSANGSATFQAGKFGQAFSFDGTPGTVAIPASLSYEFGTGDFSVSLWLFLRSIGHGTAGITAKDTYSGSGSYNGWLINAADAFGFEVRAIPGVETHARSAHSDVPLNQWNHIAVVRRGRVLEYYVNGTLRSSGMEATPANVSNSAPLYIGSLTPSAPQNMNGLVDEYRLYSHAMSATEIQADIAGPTGQPEETTTIVAGLRTGLFGHPTQGLAVGTNETAMLPLATFQKKGEAILIETTGLVTLAMGQPGLQMPPDGVSLRRAPLRYSYSFANDMVFSPVEHAVMANGGRIPISDMDTTIPNFGGLFGAFVPGGAAGQPEFLGINADLVAHGVSPQAPFFVGSRKVFIAPGPGTLLVGINNPHLHGSTGAFTVRRRFVQALNVVLDSDSVIEGTPLSGVVSVLEAAAVATPFSLSVPGDARFGPLVVVLPAGQTSVPFTIGSADNTKIERHKQLRLQVTAVDFHTGDAGFELRDNDWVGLDENDDQMSDVWQSQFQVAAGDRDSDMDGDGLPNWQEELWGTDPRASGSIPRIQATAVSEGVIKITAPTVLGQRFHVECSERLTEFRPITDVISGDGGLFEIEIGVTAPNQFFRMAADPPLDSDWDGLSDMEEGLLGTNTYVVDSDGDGASDGFEMSTRVDLRLHGLAGSPGAAASGSEGFAPKQRTNPSNPDEDGNGLFDGYQVGIHTVSGAATHRKHGFEPYVLPISGAIPIYKTQVKSWTEIENIIAPDINPPCLPEIRWGAGSYTVAYSNNGYITATSTSERLRQALLGVPVNLENSPEGWALMNRPGGFFEQNSQGPTAFNGIYGTWVPGACFDQDGQLYKPSRYFTIWGSVSGQLSNEFTTVQNIDLAWQAAEPGFQLNQSEGGAYVRLDNGEIRAMVGRTKYRFYDAQGGQPQCALVFSPADGGMVQVQSGGAQGEIPFTKEPGESGLCVLGQPDLSAHCVPYDPASRRAFIGSTTALSFTIGATVTPAIAHSIEPYFSGSCGGGTVGVAFNPAVKSVAVNLTLVAPLETEQELAVQVKGLKIWSITLSPDLPANQVAGRFITPSGDPVAAPNDGFPNLVGQNEFTFRNGSCLVRLDAVVSCAADLDTSKLRFDVDSISGSNSKWASPEIGGFTSRVGNVITTYVIYQGMPTTNSAFGRKTARLLYDGRVLAQADYEIFFSKYEITHPSFWTDGNGNVPNWFYYWKEGGVCGIPPTALYDPGAGGGASSPGLDPEKRIYLGDEAADSNRPLTLGPVGNFPQIIVGGSGQGIQSVAQIVKHEMHHYELYDYGLGKQHSDSDYIADEDEATLDGIATDPAVPDTYGIVSLFPAGSEYDRNGDAEIRCRKVESDHPPIFPRKDWANPGCQSKNQFGPRP